MPIYEYRCLKCKKSHEIIRKFSDKPLKICPACGGKLIKGISLSGFQLKGSGWYKDGYSSPKPEKKSVEKSETKTEKGTKEAVPKESKQADPVKPKPSD